jgi:hypothetical protein
MKKTRWTKISRYCPFNVEKNTTDMLFLVLDEALLIFSSPTRTVRREVR